MGGEWETVTLESLIEAGRSISYGVVQPGSMDPSGVPIVRVTDVRNGRIESTKPLKISAKIEAGYSRTRLRGGELLLTLVGTVGESAIVPKEMAGWNTARAVAVVPVRRDVGSLWVLLALRAPGVRELIESRLNTTVQATLNLRDVARLPIALPPKGEREAIAHILGTLDDKIELSRRMNETLEAMARALFQSWFVDFDPVRAKAEGRDPGLPQPLADLFPDRFEESELGDVPSGWRVGSFLEVARLLSGGTPKTDRPEFWAGHIPWASAKDVSQCRDLFLVETERTISELGLAESATQMIPADCSVIVARGATTGRLVLLGGPMAMNQTCYALETTTDAPYALNCLLQRHIGTLVNAAHGSVFDTITTNTFRASRIILPPTALLAEFELAAAPFFRRALAGVKETLVLTNCRDTLLPKLLSGNLRLKGAERFVSEVA